MESSETSIRSEDRENFVILKKNIFGSKIPLEEYVAEKWRKKYLIKLA